MHRDERGQTEHTAALRTFPQHPQVHSASPDALAVIWTPREEWGKGTNVAMYLHYKICFIFNYVYVYAYRCLSHTRSIGTGRGQKKVDITWSWSHRHFKPLKKSTGKDLRDSQPLRPLSSPKGKEVTNFELNVILPFYPLQGTSPSLCFMHMPLSWKTVVQLNTAHKLLK